MYHIPEIYQLHVQTPYLFFENSTDPQNPRPHAYARCAKHLLSKMFSSGNITNNNNAYAKCAKHCMFSSRNITNKNNPENPNNNAYAKCAKHVMFSSGNITNKNNPKNPADY